MRRAACEITSNENINLILQKCHVCRLGLIKDNVPYIVPVSFGYSDNAIYFHTAQEGQKVEFIDAGHIACFELELGVRLLTEGSNPCDWGFSYQSVIGYGTIHELTEHQEKVRGLELILRQYVTGKWPMAAPHVEHTRVWKLDIESITGKQSEDHFCP